MGGEPVGAGTPDPGRVNTLAELSRELDRLRRRAAHGSRRTRVSLDELARRVGLPRSTVHAYVSGRSLAPADVLDAIVIQLGAGAAEQRGWADAWQRVSDHAESVRRAGRKAEPGPAPGPRGGGYVQPVPRQLPPGPVDFTGRAAELAALDALLAERTGDRPVIVAICGPAGVGKTALALHWAHRVRPEHADGQLYVNLHGHGPVPPRDPAQVLEQFLRALGVPAEQVPAEVEERTALVRSTLAGRRTVIVLDNARDAAQVRPLLPGTAGCLVLVTSRRPLTGLVAAEGAHLVRLELFSAREARRLLGSRLGVERLAAEPAAVKDIIASCAGLPLALTIVAARVVSTAGFPLRTVAAELRDRPRLDALASGDPDTDVRVVFSWSYRDLTPDAARLFRLLGLHPGPDIGIPAAASLAGVPAHRARALLAELGQASLIVEHRPGRYSLHDLLSGYAAELSQATDPDGERRAAIGRVLDHYLHTAFTAGLLLHPHREPITLGPPRPAITPEPIASREQALTWFTTEYATLLAAVDHAATAGWDTHTWQLAWTLGYFQYQQGHWHDWAAVARTAVTAARLADPPERARAHVGLANACAQLGRLEEAHTHLACALELSTLAGDDIGRARAHRTIAHLRGRQGSFAEALDHAGEALEVYRAAGQLSEQARALNAIGWYHAQVGDHRRALTCCQRALALLQETGDRTGEAGTWDSLGYAYRELGDHPAAVACYRRAAEICREVGDSFEEAVALTHLGDAHHAAGEPAAARAAWQQALAVIEDLDLHHPEADGVRAKLDALDAPHPRWTASVTRPVEAREGG